MKIFNIIIAISLIMGFVNLNDLSGQKNNDMDLFTVQVDGLGCPFCAYGLEKKIKKLKGVKNLKIDIEDAVMTFSYPTDKILALKDVETQVDEAGYTAVSTSVVRADGTSEKSAFEISDKIEKNRVVKATIQVAGVCGMCRARIKKATRSIEGVVESDWDEKTQILTVKYDKGLTDTDAIEQAIASSGHDTKNVKAPDDVYDKLPACCFYKRIHQ